MPHAFTYTFVHKPEMKISLAYLYSHGGLQIITRHLPRKLYLQTIICAPALIQK